MTDQGPMRPGCRARAEAAEARVAEMERQIARRDEMYDEVEAGALAAEAREQALRDRVGELIAEWEAAMGPRVLIDRDGTCDGCAEWKDRLVVSYPLPDSEPWLCQECDDEGRREINDLRALLSPPTADTEESDRG